MYAYFQSCPFTIVVSNVNQRLLCAFGLAEAALLATLLGERLKGLFDLESVQSLVKAHNPLSMHGLMGYARGRPARRERRTGVPSINPSLAVGLENELFNILSERLKSLCQKTPNI